VGRKNFTALTLVSFAFTLFVSPIVLAQEEGNKPCPVHDEPSTVAGVEKLSTEEQGLYDELWKSFGEAGNIAPPLTIEALSIVSILADLSNDLNDDDKLALDAAGKNFIRATKIVNRVFPMLFDPLVIKDKEKIQLIKEQTGKLKQLTISVRDWVASWAKRLNLPNLGIVPYSPSRFSLWEKEVVEEKDEK